MNEPEEKQDPQLERFAERLNESLPELPADAMLRIEQAMHGEMQCHPTPVFWHVFRIG